MLSKTGPWITVTEMQLVFGNSNTAGSLYIKLWYLKEPSYIKKKNNNLDTLPIFI